ncbi:MAG: sulfatase [Verrucomicrobiota bacterium]
MRIPSLFLCAALLFPAITAPAAAKRPNILFCFADDWGRYASIYAKVDGPGTLNDVIKTPNIDRVAREGVLFKHAFVNAPSCTPCRSALLSGQYFWRTGRAAILQGAIWDAKIPSFPLLLKEAGYHIGQTYKVWSPGTPNDAPYGGNETGYESGGGRYNQFSQNVTKMVAAGKGVAAAKQELYDEVKGNLEAFLAARKPGQPFCYWFGPTQVHRKWIKGSGKALWGIEPDSLKGKLPKFLPDVHEVREDLADYFGEAQAFDAGVGIMLKKLEELGELDNTLLVVSGDHGAPGFPYGKCNLYDFGVNVALAVRGAGAKGGRVVDDFVNLMDLAPTFLEAGGVKPPEVMTGRSIMNVLKSSKTGLVDPQRTYVVVGRERHVAAARAGFVPYPQRAIRTKDYLYILNFMADRWPMGDPFNLDGGKTPSVESMTEDTFVTFMDMDASPTKAWLVANRNDPQWARFYQLAFDKRPREELYVLKDDPHQINNVASNPKYAKAREQLNGQLMGVLKGANDPRVSADPAFEHPPLAGPLAEQPGGKKKKK